MGTNYNINKVATEKEMENDNGVAEVSYADRIIRIIKTRNVGQMMEDDLLHELAHAFLYETGHDSLNTENNVEVFARFARFIRKNFVKIDKVIKKD